MSVKLIAVPFVAAAGMAMGLLMAPAAAAIDPCSSAVSTSRCLGPSGIDGFTVPAPSAGFQNGPYGVWGNFPPIGR